MSSKKSIRSVKKTELVLLTELTEDPWPSTAEAIAHAETETAAQLAAARIRLSTLRRPIGVRFRKESAGSGRYPDPQD